MGYAFLGPQQSLVGASIASYSIKILVDTGAVISVFKTPMRSVTNKKEQYREPQTQLRTIMNGHLGSGHKQVTHLFIVVPDCPFPLLSREL